MENGDRVIASASMTERDALPAGATAIQPLTSIGVGLPGVSSRQPCCAAIASLTVEIASPLACLTCSVASDSLTRSAIRRVSPNPRNPPVLSGALPLSCVRGRDRLGGLVHELELTA